MHRRTARGNRLGLGLVGVLLLLAGAAMVAADRGWLGSGAPHRLVYTAATSRFVHAHAGWLWPVVAAGAVVAGLLFLRWLLVQTRTDRLRRITIDIDTDTDTDGGERTTGAGRTTMPAGALTDAVEHDVDALRGVRRVRAMLGGRSDAPELWLTVTTDADADLGAIRRHLADSTIPAARATLESPDLPTYLRVDVGRRLRREVA